MSKSDKIICILMILCAILVLWVFVDSVVNFVYPSHFYKRHPEIELFIGQNVVSAWANFAFFTHITILLWGIWALMYAICKFCNPNGKIFAFVAKDTVVCFVFVNYLMTAVLYTIFTLCSGDFTFGLVPNMALGWHCFGTNILSHYVIFAFAVYILCTIPTSQGNISRAMIFSGTMLAIYYTIVKLTGEFAYNIRWFPYVIFDAKSFGALFGITNYAVSVALLVMVCVAILGLYLWVYFRLIKFKRKQMFRAIY